MKMQKTRCPIVLVALSDIGFVIVSHFFFSLLIGIVKPAKLQRFEIKTFPKKGYSTAPHEWNI
jgi:hypothetical protein